MGYEASAHQAQMKILRTLLLSPSATFAHLQKVTGLGSDHFTFHIHKLVQEGYVEKQSDGAYILTQVGKEYANRMDTDEHVIEKQPKIGVSLNIENGKGQFLAQQRLKQPYYGFWGRPTGKIRWGEQFLETAARELMEETGLTADLRVSGFYHKLDYDQESGELLEDKLFCIIHGTHPRGQLVAEMEGHINRWMTLQEIMAQDKVFQSIPEIAQLATARGVQFVEHKYDYLPEEY